jgi:septin family protein
MTKANEFTPAQIKAIRKIIRDEIARHNKRLERDEKQHQQELDKANAEAAMTARDWGDLD